MALIFSLDSGKRSSLLTLNCQLIMTPDGLEIPYEEVDL